MRFTAATPTSAPREWFDPEVLAYTAGLFDGEGCIYIEASSHNGRVLRVSLGQKESTILYELQRLFGGRVYEGANGRVPAWSMSSRQATAFLWSIQPWLHVKAEQALLALEFSSRPSSRKPFSVSIEEEAIREGYRQALQEAKRASL